MNELGELKPWNDHFYNGQPCTSQSAIGPIHSDFGISDGPCYVRCGPDSCRSTRSREMTGLSQTTTVLGRPMMSASGNSRKGRLRQRWAQNRHDVVWPDPVRQVQDSVGEIAAARLR